METLKGLILSVPEEYLRIDMIAYRDGCYSEDGWLRDADIYSMLMDTIRSTPTRKESNKLFIGYHIWMIEDDGCSPSLQVEMYSKEDILSQFREIPAWNNVTTLLDDNPTPPLQSFTNMTFEDILLLSPYEIAPKPIEWEMEDLPELLSARIPEFMSKPRYRIMAGVFLGDCIGKVAVSRQTELLEMYEADEYEDLSPEDAIELRRRTIGCRVYSAVSAYHALKQAYEELTQM